MIIIIIINKLHFLIFFKIAYDEKSSSILKIVISDTTYHRLKTNKLTVLAFPSYS